MGLVYCLMRIQMVEDMKVTEKRQEIGYYSGTIVSNANPFLSQLNRLSDATQDSVFAVVQLFTVLQWGKLSGMSTTPSSLS